jgi:cytidylate kinase
MGTVVFPEARVKFFVTAPAEVRAQRRFEQLKGTPQEDSLENITAALTQRDLRDTTSTVGTTKKADGAVVIVNAGRSIDDTVREMLERIRA